MDGSDLLSIARIGKFGLMYENIHKYKYQITNKNPKLNSLTFQTDPQKASFHLPLHRYFSVFLRQAVKYQGFTLKELLPEPFMLSLLMMHPLRIQVSSIYLASAKLKIKSFLYLLKILSIILHRLISNHTLRIAVQTYVQKLDLESYGG